MGKYYYFCGGCQEDLAYRESNCLKEQRVKLYERGDVIAYRGDAVNSLSILESGSISVSIVLDSGVKLPPRYHKAPYPLGALALFSHDSYYRVDIVAMEQCEVRSISRAEVEAQIMRCPLFMRNFIAYTTTKFDVVADHLSTLMHRTIKAKLAYYILTICDAASGEFTFDKRIGDLAEYLCVERPSLSRTIAQMVGDGVIEYSNRCGRVLSFAAIKRLVE